MISTYEIVVDAELVDCVITLMNTCKGSKNTNVGGWHSIRTKTVEPWFESYIKKMLEAVGPEYKLDNYWFNVNDKGHYNRWHNHLSHAKVAVYYIKAPSKSGNIEFKNSDNTITSVTPLTGQLLVFPGKLLHRVCENKSDEPRISAAFNLSKIKGLG